MMEYEKEKEWENCEVEDEKLLECMKRVVINKIIKKNGIM
jgi:hypothetical protein